MSATAVNSNRLSSADLTAIRKRHPDAFAQPFFKRFAAPITLLAIVLYTVYSFWFFSIGKVVTEGNWGIAGVYLADWVSYEVRPDVDYRTGEIRLEYPKFSPLGDNPDPSWVTTQTGTVTVTERKPAVPAPTAAAPAANSFMAPAAPTGEAPKPGLTFMAPNSDATNMGSDPAASAASETTTQTRTGIVEATVTFGANASITATPEKVTVIRDGETVVIDVDPKTQTVTPQGDLPDWMLQKTEGEKVFAYFGFAGRAEVRANEIKIYRRFLGWENFLFDTGSPYWGKSTGEVLGLVFSGPRLDADRSNLALLWDNIVNNAEWQHGDVWLKLLQTIVMAFVGTLFAVIIAFPLSFLAARNITPNRFVNQLLKRFFDFLRSVDMLIWALFFTRAFGPGPLAGISAIFFTDTGTFGKLYSETLENIDDKQREGIRSVGANPAQVQRFGVAPQVLPIFASQALYFWESNTRSATIIGAVGAGGIGLKLWEAMRTNQDWENVFYMVILILIVVFVFDNVSNMLRSRLIGQSR